MDPCFALLLRIQSIASITITIQGEIWRQELLGQGFHLRSSAEFDHLSSIVADHEQRRMDSSQRRNLLLRRGKKQTSKDGSELSEEEKRKEAMWMDRTEQSRSVT
ncbi:unnamed protein product [Musa hybrid cultivar]